MTSRGSQRGSFQTPIGIVHSHINTHTHSQAGAHADTWAPKHKHIGTETDTQIGTDTDTQSPPKRESDTHMYNFHIHIYTSYAPKYTQTHRKIHRYQGQGPEHKSHYPGPKPELGCEEHLSLESWSLRLQAQPTMVSTSSWEHSLST